ncbi:TRAP transporter large permease [uncultured Massilia sp.]|uniref:TRAP transporter large permease n=1 Tax=uncultured Massilia sp. TaxID=169973 RepID=UPI0025D5BE55|nr:TRAP transporter large permease [uncultured Massilia sp.]
MTSALVLVLMFVLLALGVPVGFTMAAAGAIGLFALGGLDMLLGVLQTAPLSTVSAYELVTVPMFLLMAEFVMASGIADDLFRAAAAWIGHIRGGLGMATALTGAGFGAMCGTSTASAAALSATSLPAMLKQGYEPKMAAGVVAISGTLSMLIPPAVALVIFGLLAEVNIGKLLVAGLIPAFLVMLTIMATVYLLAVFDPQSAPASARVGLRERFHRLRVIWPMLALMLVVTGVIYTGVATPTEASAIGAFGAFLLSVWKRGFKPAVIRQAALRAAVSSCMIATIIMGAQIFGYFFAMTHVTQDIVLWVGALDTSRWVIIVCILLMYIVLGAFMDQIAILVLTVPVVIPVIVSLGFDPIWFGVVKIVTAEVGMITPPVGLNCFIVARYANRPIGEVFQGIWPHFGAHILIIAVFLLFPQLTLWLPSLMK